MALRSAWLVSLLWTLAGSIAMAGSLPSDPIPASREVADSTMFRSCTLIGHSDTVNAVAFSRDGTRIITGGEDREARMWDAVTGHCLHVFRGHEAPILAVDFSHNGTQIVSTGWANTVTVVRSRSIGSHLEGGIIKVWDSMEGREIRTLMGGDWPIRAATFAHNDARIISIDRNFILTVWNIDTGQEFLVIDQHEARGQGFIKPSSNAFSADALHVASLNDAPTEDRRKVKRSMSFVRLWDVDKSRFQTLRADGGTLRAVDVSPDGAFVITADQYHALKLWKFSTRELIRHFGAPTDEGPVFLSFSPDGNLIVSGTEGGIVRVWDIASGRQLQTLEGPKSRVRAVVFIPDGLRVVSGGFRHLDEWDSKTNRRKIEPLTVWNVSLP